MLLTRAARAADRNRTGYTADGTAGSEACRKTAIQMKEPCCRQINRNERNNRDDQRLYDRSRACLQNNRKRQGRAHQHNPGFHIVLRTDRLTKPRRHADKVPDCKPDDQRQERTLQLHSFHVGIRSEYGDQERKYI